MKISHPDRIEQINQQASAAGQAVYLLVIATKPCYIKLATLIKTLRQRQVPTLIIDAGQHYDPVLVGAAQDFDYVAEIDIYLEIRGTLLGRTAELASQAERLHDYLHARWPATRFIPVVSGDTSTSGTFPIFWYLQTGVRAIHVEAGLRSLTPFTPGEPLGTAAVLDQASRPWRLELDEPFPEQVDTRLSSVVSSVLIAPVPRNRDNLLAEGYGAMPIRLSGSLSADAVELAREQLGASQLGQLHPELQQGKWLRVDIHRRENMSPERLDAVIDGLGQLAADGLQIVFTLTNQIKFAFARHPERDYAGRLQRYGVHCQAMWPSYFDVIQFMASPNCLAIYTDSGGLQEEANILGVPCMTCRYSTDRPETILDSASNILIPPYSAALVYQAIAHCLDSGLKTVWCDLGRNIYGRQVAVSIVDTLLATARLQ